MSPARTFDISSCRYFVGADYDEQSEVDLVVVGSLTPDGHRHPSQTLNRTLWPDELFLKQWTRGRALVYQYQPKSGITENLRRTIEDSAGRLGEAVEKFREGQQNAPWVFCCHGLGGLTLLKTLYETKGRRGLWTSPITSILFIGTPLSPGEGNDLKEFGSTLRGCWTFEQGLGEKKKAAKLELAEVRELFNLIAQLNYCSFPVASFAETESLPYRKGGIFAQPTCIIVGRQQAHTALSNCLCSTAPIDHRSVDKVDDALYQAMSTFIGPKIPIMANHRPSNANVPYRPPSTTNSHPGASIATITAISTQVSPIPSATQNTSSPSNGLGTPNPAPTLTVQTQRFPKHSFPPKNKYFKGREEMLEHIKQRLQRSNSGGLTRQFALTGFGGQGKSQTALQFAYKNEKDYAYIFWLGAETEITLMSDMHECAVGLGLRKPAEDQQGSARRLKQFLSSTNEEWLLIFDNAEDTKLVVDWCPQQSGSGAALITSRHPKFAGGNVANDGKELPKLPVDAGVEMILSQLDPDALQGNFNPWEEARIIVDLVDGLPVCIQAAVGMIRKVPGTTIREFNESYSTSRLLISHASADTVVSPNSAYRAGPSDMLKLLVSSLTTDGRNLAGVMVFLDPDRIQKNLLFHGSKEMGAIIPLKCIDELLNGVITQNRTYDNVASYKIHRLCQEMVESMMTQSQRHKAFAVAAHILSDALGEPTVQSAPNDLKEHLRHVERLHTYLGEQTETSAIAIRHYAVQQFAQLLRKAARVCYRRGIFETGFLYLKSAHAALDANTPDDPSSAEGQELLMEAAHLAYIHGCISTEIGDFQSSLVQFQHAKQCYEKLNQMGNTSLPPKFYTNCIGSIANSLNGLGRDAEAETLFRQCLDGGKPDNFKSAYEVNICRCYWSAGKLDQAADRLTKLIQLREGQYGPNDTEDYLMGHMLYCLGNVRISQLRANEAFGLHERALGCWKATYGEEHHKTGDAYHKVAWHQSWSGDDHSARDNLKEALRVYSGSDRRFRKGEIARSNFKLASVYEKLGCQTESADCRAEAERLRKELQGTNYTPNADEKIYDSLVSLWAR